MGKTVPSYRIAIENKMLNQKEFRHGLPGEIDKEAVDEIMEMCRNNVMAAQNACSPIFFKPMAINILLGQQKKIRKLECRLSVSDGPVIEIEVLENA